jgi:lysophospholipase L1-like esterase
VRDREPVLSEPLNGAPSERRDASRSRGAGTNGRSRGRIPASLVLLAVSVGSTLMALEGAVRLRDLLHGSRMPPAARERLATTVQASMQLHRPSPDPLLIYEPKPGAVVQRDGTVYRINTLGLRDDREVEPPATSERRIVILGDSVAFGLGVDDRHTFARLLERSPGGPPLRVLNQAVLGYKTAQEVRRFELDGWRLQPAGVLLTFCLNDFDDFSGELPMLAPRGPIAPGDFRRLPPRRLGGLELPESVPVLDRSRLFAKLSERLLRLDYYRWIGGDPQRRAEVAEALADLGRQVHAGGVPALVAIFPLLVETDPYPYRELHEFVAASGRAAGMQVIDLLDPLAAGPLAAVRRSPDDVLHLNELGHTLVARALAGCLRDPGLRCP